MPKQNPYNKHFIGTNFSKPGASISRNTRNPDKFSKTVANDCSEYPKIQLQHLLEGQPQVFSCNYQSFFLYYHLMKIQLIQWKMIVH